jgi:acetylornithine deacetylase/succinyl-diaminopimelate desuccinylase-like protein
MDADHLRSYVNQHINEGVIPTLIEFVKIPSLSPDFDPNWESNGFMVSAMNLIIKYVDSLEIKNLTHRILKEPGKPWLFFGTLPATDASLPTVLMYGHFDKQPHMEGWSEGLGPTTPVIKNDRLYGRGASDDGYAIPTSALILKALQDHSIPHGKIVLIGENEEESDSGSLIYYVNSLKPEIGNVDIVVCLDSGVLTYDRLWSTTSLRGIMNLDLTVKTLKAGVHSGGGSGIIPSTFRILQMLIGRIEDRDTGKILIPELHTRITPQNYIDKASTVKVIGDAIHNLIPFEDGVKTVSEDFVQMYIDNTYAPTLVVTGIEGMPELQKAGNVLLPVITARLSIRIPPGVEATKALDAVKRELLRDPPYNAQVKVNHSLPDNGWAQKPNQPWLDEALSKSSEKYFGNPALKLGEGGTIPFIGFLGDTFPEAQFIITGLLGADSNAHSVDENLDIPYLKKLTCCMIETFQIIGTRSTL